jgi:hypothetical protein
MHVNVYETWQIDETMRQKKLVEQHRVIAKILLWHANKQKTENDE